MAGTDNVVEISTRAHDVHVACGVPTPSSRDGAGLCTTSVEDAPLSASAVSVGCSVVLAPSVLPSDVVPDAVALGVGVGYVPDAYALATACGAVDRIHAVSSVAGRRCVVSDGASMMAGDLATVQSSRVAVSLRAHLR